MLAYSLALIINKLSIFKFQKFVNFKIMENSILNNSDKSYLKINLNNFLTLIKVNLGIKLKIKSVKNWPN